MADAAGPAYSGPLAGIRVLDFSRLAPGPMATAILGDLGADVLQVEEPGGGRRVNEERQLRGFEEVDAPAIEARRRASPFGRHKQSIAINLKHPRGREIALALGREVDVAVEGFRPGVMARLGLGFEALQAVNRGIIYCSLSGYGQTGPRSTRVGHDLNYIADSGVLSLFAAVGARGPIVPPNLLADYAGGSLQAVIGILSALVARASTGRGQYIDVSLAEGALALLGPEAAGMAASGAVPSGGHTRLTGTMAYYNVYETSDGRHLSLGCNEPAFFRELCAVLDLPELVERQQLPDAAWQRHATDCIQERIGARTLAEWELAFAGRDVAFAPVRRLDEVMRDEHYISRGLIQQTDHGPVVGSPFHLSDTPVRPAADGPLAGEHTRARLGLLGLGTSEIDELYANGVVA